MSKYVYRLQPSNGVVKSYEVGECDNPRSYDGWCDRRVCEGFWGNEDKCKLFVQTMNDNFTQK